MSCQLTSYELIDRIVQHILQPDEDETLLGQELLEINVLAFNHRYDSRHAEYTNGLVDGYVYVPRNVSPGVTLATLEYYTYQCLEGQKMPQSLVDLLERIHAAENALTVLVESAAAAKKDYEVTQWGE